MLKNNSLRWESLSNLTNLEHQMRLKGDRFHIPFTYRGGFLGRRYLADGGTPPAKSIVLKNIPTGTVVFSEVLIAGRLVDGIHSHNKKARSYFGSPPVILSEKRQRTSNKSSR